MKREAGVGAELPMVLREAHGIVAEQLARLRELADNNRRAGAALSGELRQAERQLDEASLQCRTALDRGAATTSSLTRREAELRASCEKLAVDMRTNQHALKQLEQLI